MKKLLLALSFCAALWAVPASATCSAVFKPGSVCGNAGASNAFPGEIPNSSIVGTIPLPSADILVGNASNKAAAVAPSGAGDCTFGFTNAGVFTYTCLKTNGVSFGPFATGTNAANLTGTVPSSTLPSPFTNGTATGNTSKFATSTGTLTTNNCVKIDASGNYIDAGVACGGTGITVGSTTVTSGTSHGVLTNNAGALGNTAAGSVGQSLVGNGASAEPTFQSGTWTLLATLTASNSASLNDQTACGGSNCITSTYNEYEIVFENLLPATTSVNCEIQVHSGGTFQSTGYNGEALRYQSTTVTGVQQTTFIPCDGSSGGTINTGTGVNGKWMLYKPSQASSPKLVTGEFTYSITGPAFVGGVFAGGWGGGNGAVDGFQVLFSSGNITSGTIKIYGRL